MTNTLEKLIKARGLIADPKNWCKGERFIPAKRGRGTERYCAVGAHETAGIRRREGRELFAGLVGRDITVFNDRPSTTHACVLAAFDAAIELQGMMG